MHKKAEKLAREKHIPSIIHVIEMTQPTGHSTSGSHERYKSKERLQWEIDYDCNKKFKEWIIDSGIATDDELNQIDNKANRFSQVTEKRVLDRVSSFQSKKSGRNSWIYLIKYLLR